MKNLYLLAALLLVGCAGYSSRIKMPDGTTLVLPKDLKADGLILKREWTDTNGHLSTLYFAMTNFTAKMNPAVIDSKTAHDIGLINAGAQAAGAIAGAAAGTAVKP